MLKRFTALLLALLTLATFAAACGDDDDGDATATGDSTKVTAPEDVKAPADEVAAGLEEMDQLAKDVVTALEDDDTDKASELYDEAHEVWEDVEGTVKDNDEDAYIAFEDALSSLETAAADGDVDKASAASVDISAAVSTYLEAYPG